MLSDDLPATVTFVSATPDDGSSCALEGGTVLCDLADLAPGDTTTVVIVASTPPDAVPAGQPTVTLSNQAVVSTTTPDADPGNDQAAATTVVIAEANLVPSKVGPETAVAGTSVTYTVGATNAGPSVARDVVVSDRVVPNLRFVPEQSDPACALTDPGTNTVTCAAPADLAVGAQRTFTVVAVVDASLAEGSILTNTATTTSAVASTMNQEPATVSTAIEALADLSIAKSASAPNVAAGSGFAYAFVVTNDGPSSAFGLTLADVGPAPLLGGGLSIGAKGMPACPLGGVQFTCVIPQLAPNQSLTLTVPVTTDPALPDGTVVENVASIQSVTPDPDLANNVDGAVVTVVREAALTLAKSASTPTASPGQEVAWTLTVGNSALRCSTTSS